MNLIDVTNRSYTPPNTTNSYAEAHKIKLKSDALEAWELEKWHAERQQDLLGKVGTYVIVLGSFCRKRPNRLLAVILILSCSLFFHS